MCGGQHLLVTDRRRRKGARKTEPPGEGPKRLTAEELEALEGQELPGREVMSVVEAGVAGEVNAAIAVNVLTDDSVEISDAADDESAANA
jgi:hypothetical protein